MNLFGNLKKKMSDVAENVKDRTKELTESIKDGSVSESMKDLAKKGGDAFDSFKNSSTEFIQNTANSILKKEEVPTELFDAESALKIIYYLMSVDGQIDPEEEEKYDAIGKDMDPDFDVNKEAIVNECISTISKSIDHYDLYDTIHDSVGEIIRESFSTSQGSFPPILLIWNLLAIAHSEENYSEAEKRLIRYVARQTNVDKSALDIMENTIETIIALEKEETWLKTTNRSYLDIEKNLNEIADRKLTLMQSVQALMLD